MPGMPSKPRWSNDAIPLVVVGRRPAAWHVPGEMPSQTGGSRARSVSASRTPKTTGHSSTNRSCTARARSSRRSAAYRYRISWSASVLVQTLDLEGLNPGKQVTSGVAIRVGASGDVHGDVRVDEHPSPAPGLDLTEHLLDVGGRAAERRDSGQRVPSLPVGAQRLSVSSIASLTQAPLDRRALWAALRIRRSSSSGTST